MSSAKALWEEVPHKLLRLECEVRVTVVVPCRNEEAYIGACLESILATTWPADQLEVLVVDGMSGDNTRPIADDYVKKHSNVRLLDNPRMIVSAALNIGIAQAEGEVIMRMDAHAEYPRNYIPVLVNALVESGADNTGACVNTLPANGSATARAIALALSHPLGVGNSAFRTGATEPRWVDTVPFGCFRRALFDRVGRFDEQLVRNQDDEFNHRLLKKGGRILLHPGTRASYYGRRNYGQLFRMYYQYGLFKPLAARKIGGIMTLRQIVPAAFVLALASLALVGLFFMPAALALAAILTLYTGALLAAALPLVRKHGVACAAAFVPAVAIMHFSYGLGYLRGLPRAWGGSSSMGLDAAAAVKMSR